MRLFNFGRKEKKGTKTKGWRKRRHAEPRTYTVEDKVKILKEYEVAEGTIPIDRFCKWWCISPDTLKGWQRRYKAEGEAGLVPRPKHKPKAEVPQAIKDKVIEIKQKEPRFGVRRIADYLARHKFYKVSDETVREILNTDERVASLKLPVHEAKGGKREPAVKRFERSKPRQLYQMGIMTWMLKGLYRVYLIGCLDDYSRYVVSWGLFRRQSNEHAIDVLRAGIERYGGPEEVLTENGRQFYTWRGKSEFQKYLIKRGIKHIRSRPYHPATLGKIESFWRNMYQGLLSQVAIGSFEEAEEKLKGWIEDYNFKRPHQGIGGLVPADRFFGVDKSIKEAMVEGAGIVKESLILNPKEVKEPMYIIGRIGGKEIRIIAKEGSVVRGFRRDRKKGLSRVKRRSRI